MFRSFTANNLESLMKHTPHLLTLKCSPEVRIPAGGAPSGERSSETSLILRECSRRQRTGLSFHGLIKTSDRRRDPRLASGEEFHNHSTLPREQRPLPQRSPGSAWTRRQDCPLTSVARAWQRTLPHFRRAGGEKSREGETTRDPVSRLTS